MQLDTIVLNEVFGPTFQGEGMEVGKPCFFIRTQGCPVQCPGCDTAYTWNGTEQGTPTNLGALRVQISNKLELHPGCGVVVSGGEPLIHYANQGWTDTLAYIRIKAAWLSLETSGFIGPVPITTEKKFVLGAHLQTFTSVHCSPKITPCLRGPKWTQEQATVNVDSIIDACWPDTPIALKFVVRDQADLDVVNKYVDEVRFRLKIGPEVPIYLMPYGITRDEVTAGCERLLPWCAKYGYFLSPRLHALLWGAKRGV